MGQGDSIGALVTRLIDSGKAYLHAEIRLLRQTGLAWFARARIALALGIVALFLVQASLTVLIAALGLAFARWIGIAGGLALGGVVGLVSVGLLLWIAVRSIRSEAE